MGKEDSTTWDSSGLMKASTLGAIMERVRMVIHLSIITIIFAVVILIVSFTILPKLDLIAGGAGGSAVGSASGSSSAADLASIRADLKAITCPTKAELRDVCPSVTCPSPAESGAALGLPGMEQISWDTVRRKAATTTLNFYLWSPIQAGNPSKPRKFVDNELAPNLKKNYGITVNRMDAVYTGCDKAAMKVVCDVSAEVAAGKTTTGGSVDLIWINGANFAAMKDAGLLYGPWATIIPSASNFDFTNDAISFDKGVATNGLEFPFHISQAVFIYDTAIVPTPPATLVEFEAWVLANPGKFAYSDPSTDFTGSAFIRHFFMHYGATGGSVHDLTNADGSVNEAIYKARAPKVWEQLNKLEAGLMKDPANPGQPYYPVAHGPIRDLVGKGTLTMDFSMQVSEATSRMAATEINPWPKTMKAYVLTSGTIADTNYLAIPINAPNKEAALIAVNHIGSAGSMFKRSTPEQWGALQAFNPKAPLIKEWDFAFDYVAKHDATPTVESLSAGRLGDVSHQLLTRINADWVLNVKNL